MPPEKDSSGIVRSSIGLDRRREEPSRDGEGGHRIGVRHEDRELVAADPERPVGMPSRRDEQPSHRRQRVVTAGVAALVVDPLQVVEVEQQQGQRRGRPLGVGDGSSQLLLEGAVVAEPGQRIEQRRQPGAVVLLAEVVAGGLEALRRGQDRARKDDHQQRQRDADDDHAQEGDDGLDVALTRLEVAEERPEQDLRGEDDGEGQHQATADRRHPDAIGLVVDLAVPVEDGHVRYPNPR